MRPRGRIRSYLKGNSIWLMVYAIYIALILISVHSFIAQQTVDEIRTNMDEKYDYYLTFPGDGKVTHYDVTLHNTSIPGKITLTYWTGANKLDIKEVTNIKTLKIDVLSMFQDEVEKVFKSPQANIPTMDMDYWFEAGDGIFIIDFNIAFSESMESLTFTKFPTPTSVLVNNQEWWQTNLNYTISGNEITISNIPTNKTTVIIDFNTPNQLPVAAFTMNPPQEAGVNQYITFDGSNSYDPDGNITSWRWDFGDGSEDSGVIVTHKYSLPGVYVIRLTVRDDAEPFGEAWLKKNITVTTSIVNQLPVAAFIMNPQPVAGVDEDITFDGSLSFDPDGNITSWQWDFGDNTSGSGEVVGHNYSIPGTYIIRLSVRDDAVPFGETWLDKSITVAYGADEDIDEDGLRDHWEQNNFGNLDYGPTDDPDSDGYDNELEYLTDTDPTDNNDFKEDSDSDGLPDLWEWGYFRTLAYGPNDDPDGDLASNKAELDAGTNPNDPNDFPQEPVDGDGKKSDEPSGFNIAYAIIPIIIIIVIIIIVAVLFRKKKTEERVPEEYMAAPVSEPEAAPLVGEPAVPPAPPVTAPGVTEAPPAVEAEQPPEEPEPPIEAPPEEVPVEEQPPEPGAPAEEPTTEELPPEIEPSEPELEVQPSELHLEEHPDFVEPLPETEVPAEEIPPEQPPSEPEVTEEKPAEEPAAEGGEVQLVPCPTCQQMIPVYTTPCPNCGQHFNWQ